MVFRPYGTRNRCDIVDFTNILSLRDSYFDWSQVFLGMLFAISIVLEGQNIYRSFRDNTQYTIPTITVEYISGTAQSSNDRCSCTFNPISFFNIGK